MSSEDVKKDEQGRIVYYRTKGKYGMKHWIDYDKDGNIIHRKYEDGYEEWNKYKNGKLVHRRDTKWYKKGLKIGNVP